MSDILLKLIALRLGALLLAGLVIRALPQQPVDIVCMPRGSLVRAVAPDLAQPRGDDDVADMRRHD